MPLRRAKLFRICGILVLLLTLVRIFVFLRPRKSIPFTTFRPEAASMSFSHFHRSDFAKQNKIPVTIIYYQPISQIGDDMILIKQQLRNFVQASTLHHACILQHHDTTYSWPPRYDIVQVKATHVYAAIIEVVKIIKTDAILILRGPSNLEIKSVGEALQWWALEPYRPVGWQPLSVQRKSITRVTKEQVSTSGFNWLDLQRGLVVHKRYFEKTSVLWSSSFASIPEICSDLYLPLVIPSSFHPPRLLETEETRQEIVQDTIMHDCFSALNENVYMTWPFLWKFTSSGEAPSAQLLGTNGSKNLVVKSKPADKLKKYFVVSACIFAS